MTGVFIKRGNLETGTHTGKPDVKRLKKKCPPRDPGERSGTASFPHRCQKGPTLPIP